MRPYSVGQIAVHDPPPGRTSALIVDIPGYTDEAGFTEYYIQATVGVQHFTVQHRYTDFLQLHEKLVAALELPEDLASFPVPKSLLRFTDVVKEERKATLCAYLRRVVDVCSDKTLPPSLVEFLGIDVVTFLHSGKYPGVR